MLITKCTSTELSFEAFKKQFPMGSFDCFSVPALNGESDTIPTDVMAVSFVVPVQDNPQVLQVSMLNDATEDEYAYLMYAARSDEEFSEGDTYQTVDEAIRAAKSAAFACASGQPSLQ